MRTVLITGAAGFIGANFTHYWLAHHAHDRVIALDALTYAGNTWNLKDVWQHPQFSFVTSDQLVADPDRAIQGIDALFRAMAEALGTVLK